VKVCKRASYKAGLTKTDNMKETTTLHTALAKAQTEFPTVKKADNNPFFKSKYAGLPSVLEVVLPTLHKNGLYLSQSPINEGDKVGVKTKIIHAETGESLEDSFTMTLAKNDPQGAGSAITYARRYALVAMLGLNVDDDDDGNLATNLKPPKALTKADKDVDIINDEEIY
jgi:hypothetical protein